MFDVAVEIVDHFQQVAAAARAAEVEIISHAAASIRKDAIASIETSPEPSAPGEPPHTRRRQLPGAILFDVDSTIPRAIVGPRASRVGLSGRAHEVGGAFKGQEYPERPFMGPALEHNEEQFAGAFAGSLGG